MNNWLQPLKKALKLKTNFVMLTVVETKGSTPCSAGDKVIYAGKQSTYGSIGGGNLEYQALQHAQDLLNQSEVNTHLQKYPLGATLGQCCGGYVRVMFESFTNQNANLKNANLWAKSMSDLIEKKKDFVVATIISSETEKQPNGKKIIHISNDGETSKAKDLNRKILDGAETLLSSSEATSIVEISSTKGEAVVVCYEKLAFSEIQAVAVFGAGHIAQALMPILINLPITVYWIDDRPLQFEEYSGDVSQINIICDNFSDVVDELPKDSYCLVITYSHQSDFEICEQVISHDSFSYLGMIGSKTKGNKFRERLRQKGWPNKKVDELICPIGAKQKFFKSPSAIAVSIAMDLLNFLEKRKQMASL